MRVARVHGRWIVPTVLFVGVALGASGCSCSNPPPKAIALAVSSPSGATTEAGGQATFTLALSAKPTAEVVVPLASSNAAEGTLAVASVTFTPDDWSAPLTVTVTGVDDDVVDGPVAYTIALGPSTSTDSAANGLVADAVALTNTDNDSAGITVSAPSGPTTEGGAQATFTIVLDSAPSADVTVHFVSSDEAEGVTDGTSRTFTTANWKAPRTVTVTGVDDSAHDGLKSYAVNFSVTTSADPKYAGLTPKSVALVNVDDDSAGVTVSPPTGPTTEAGGQASFTVVLNSKPTADVTLSFDSNKPSEATVAVKTLTFTPTNWNAPQTVVVTGVDDTVADGNQAFAVVFAPTVSTDPAYAALTPASIPMSNVDDDSAGLTVSAASGPTTEAGGQATFTVVLNSKPSADVVVSFDSTTPTEGTVATKSLTFTPSNYAAKQTVTVTGVDDALADGSQPYAIVFSATVSGDPGYSGLTPPSVAMTNVDNETAGIFVSAPSGPTTEAGGQATFTLVLNSRPAQDVTVSFTSSNVAEGTVSPSSVTFTSLNWAAPQTVVLTGVDDAVSDGNQLYTVVFAPSVSADPLYNGLTAPKLTATNVDNDSPGFVVGAVSGPTTEAGGQATFTVALRSRPLADVTLSLSSTNTAEGTVSPSSLTFTSLDWNAPKTVTVTGVDDLVADGNRLFAVSFTPAVSTDTNYATLAPQDVNVTNVDDDSAGIVVSQPSAPTTEGGGTATFTVVLRSQPSADVTVSFDSSNPAEGIVDVKSLTFTTLNWNAPRTVTLTGVNDAIADGNQLYFVTFAATTSTDAAYAALTPAKLAVTNVDDDSAGILVGQVSGPTTESGGTATFTVVLASQPTADVTVNFSSSNTQEGTLSATSLTFTTTNWSVPRTVTLTGVDDLVADGNQVYQVVFALATSADPIYAALRPANLFETNVDNDSAGFLVSQVSGPTTESGGTATFTLALSSKPTANVTVNFSSSNTLEGTLSVTSLTFTPTNWNVARVVTLTGVDDQVADGNQLFQIVFSATTSTDATYAARTPPNLFATNVDNDTAAILVSAIDRPTSESGGVGTFTVVLGSKPTANVTVNFASNTLAEGVTSVTSLLFTPANWNVARSVTVTGVNDAVADGNVSYAVVFSATTSTDPLYAVLKPAQVNVTNLDNDTAGIIVSQPSGPTTEAGGTATFTVVLRSQPVANVTVNFNSNKTTEGTCSVTSLTFTSANWSLPRTVTVTGVNDFASDGTQLYAIVFTPTVSADGNYAGVVPPSLTLVNFESKPGFNISAASGPTTESGGTATFTVVLLTQPTADVTLNFASNKPTEGVTLVPSLTFTPFNWSITQTVTVKGVDDAVLDGTQPYGIVFSATTSADPDYAPLTPSPVLFNNLDNETVVLWDFNTGLMGWTTTANTAAVWNADATPGSVAGGAAFHSSPYSLNYNNGVSYDPGGVANSGTATSPAVDISAYPGVQLTFWCNYQTESTTATWDRRRVQVSNDNFATTLLDVQLSGGASAAGACAAMGTWHQHTVPLNSAWGTIRLRTTFNTIDGIANGYAGWFVDDFALSFP